MTDLLARLQTALAGRYAVERELGRGGMATVYLATDQTHERPVAVNVLHPELAAVLGAERFLREIKLTARLNHSHVLPLLDSGEADGFLLVRCGAGDAPGGRELAARRAPGGPVLSDLLAWRGGTR